MRLSSAFIAAGFTAATATGALAAYPDKPITYIVPYGVGGAADISMRLAEPYLEKCLGQDIIVINKPGAGGAIGDTELAAAAPDGYTLGSLLTPNLETVLASSKDLRFTFDSFEFIGNFAASRVAVSAKRGGRFETIQQLLEAAKKEPIQAAISNFGADDHLVLKQLMNLAGVQFQFVPMVESPAARNAVIGGHVEILGLSVTESANFKEQLQTLAVAGAERFAPLPDVPTFREIGYDLIGGNTFFYGAPKGLPAEVKDKLAACFKEVGDNAEFKKAILDRNLIWARMDAAESTEFHRKEMTAVQGIWDKEPWK